MTQQRTFRLTVDGEAVEVVADPDAPLLHVLRHELGKPGTRFGCGVGLCGACFVLLDGRPAPSCDTPMWSADGKDVVTVEGLGTGGALHPVQQAFLDEQAAQCGFCVSGVLVSAAALLRDDPAPTEDAVVGGTGPQPVPVRRAAPDGRGGAAGRAAPGAGS